MRDFYKFSDIFKNNPYSNKFAAFQESFKYPKTSNALTQKDREYYAMIRSETGLSDIWIEPEPLRIEEEMIRQFRQKTLKRNTNEKSSVLKASFRVETSNKISDIFLICRKNLCQGLHITRLP